MSRDQKTLAHGLTLREANAVQSPMRRCRPTAFMTDSSCGCATATPCCLRPEALRLTSWTWWALGGVEMRALTSKVVALLGAAALILAACGPNAAPSNVGGPPADGTSASPQANAATAGAASGAAASSATTARPSGAVASAGPSGGTT